MTMTFNPASYAVAGFVDVTNMSHADRKRLAQNDDQPVFARAAAKVVAQPSAHIANWVMHLEQAAARFNVRRDNFAAGKGSTCLDIASKLEHFGDFASEAQKSFAYKLVGWSMGYNQPHPMEPAQQQAPVQAPAAPVAASKPITPDTVLDGRFVKQTPLALPIGKLTIARKNQDSLCWVKVKGHDGVVGKIEGGVLSVFTARLNVSVHGITPDFLIADLLRIEADPEAAAALHGQVSGRCSVCSRDLTDPESIARGIGPICLEKF
jgi:hypothetical protein